MIKLLLFTLFLLHFFVQTTAQSFHPAPGVSGTNAIYKDSNCFVAWATGAIINRGFLNCSDTTFAISGNNKASFGTLADALGNAEGTGTSVVSLGDGGTITLTFNQFITNGPGYDFAIFENGFTDNYMEFAHVEVSSDGVHFVRFPSVTEIPLSNQQTNFTYSDCRMVNNLAGKYRVGYGTPFDISDLTADSLLNTQAITHIRLIDVIGAIDPLLGSTDASGTLINDPFPTPFESCGFDLDGVGIINGTLNLPENTNSSQMTILQTPLLFSAQVNQPVTCALYNSVGTLVYSENSVNNLIQIDLSELSTGMYFMQITGQTINFHNHFFHQ